MLKQRNRAPHVLGLIANDIDGVGVSALDNFLRGGDLPTAVKQKLATILTQAHAVYNPETDLLETAYRDAPKTFAAVTPPQVKVPFLSGVKLPYAQGVHSRGLPSTPVKPAKTAPSLPAKLPGWA